MFKKFTVLFLLVAALMLVGCGAEKEIKGGWQYSEGMTEQTSWSWCEYEITANQVVYCEYTVSK